MLATLQHSITPADSCKGERPRQPPVGADQSRVLWAWILYSDNIPLLTELAYRTIGSSGKKKEIFQKSHEGEIATPWYAKCLPASGHYSERNGTHIDKTILGR